MTINGNLTNAVVAQTGSREGRVDGEIQVKMNLTPFCCFPGVSHSKQKFLAKKVQTFTDISVGFVVLSKRIPKANLLHGGRPTLGMCSSVGPCVH